MDQRERYPDEAESIRLALEAAQSRIWTALPCVVQSFPAASGLDPMMLDAQPVMAGSYLNSSGEEIVLQMPLLVDVPIFFPGGGGATLTFPIKPGDECLVVFASRCIDGWWQQGVGSSSAPGLKPPDSRMHNLSDGFAFVGVRSKPRSYAVNSTVAQLRSDDGTTFVQLDPNGKLVQVTAPNGITLNGVTIDANGNMNAPGNILSHKTVTGNTDVVTGAISLKGHHTSGVQTGTGTSGVPVP